MKMISDMQYNLYFCNLNLKKMTINLQEKAAMLRQIVEGCHKVVTVTHIHPDGDAVGSSIGTACWCESLGMEVTCIFPDPVPESICFAVRPERAAKTIAFSKDGERARKAVEECDLIIALDFADFSRAEGMEELLESVAKKKVQIDHHLYPSTEQFDLSVSENEISSASELAYQLLKGLVAEGFGSFTTEALESFLTGMTTDTNNFANSVWPSTLEMASEMLQAGIDRDRIVENINWHYGENRLRLLGKLLHEKMILTPGGLAVMVLRKDDIEAFDLGEGDTEGFVNIPLAIKKVRMSCFLKEYDGFFRVSLRSKKGTSANACATSYFHGGGHENAAGGKIFFPGDIPSPDEAEKYMEKISKEFFGK